MRCFIYKSQKKAELYLYLAKKDNFSVLPDLLLKNIGSPIFVMQLELSPDRKLAREDAKKVIAQVNEKGYFIQMPPIQFSAAAKLQ